MLLDHVDLAAMAAGRELARTDRQGVFTLTHLPETAFSVVARAAGFQLARAGDVRPGDVVPDMVLIRNGSVSGRVRRASCASCASTTTCATWSTSPPRSSATPGRVPS